MKKTKSVISCVLSILIILCIFSVFSAGAAVSPSGFEYEVNDSEVTITGYIGTESNLSVPQKLDGLPVTAIDYNAFANNCESLVSIVIPDTISAIDNSTFSGCTNLNNVSLPKGLEFIGDSAFSGCVSLKTIVIPDGVKEIGIHAFSHCTSLASVTIPDSIEVMGENAFIGCTSLMSVSYAGSEAAWKTLSANNNYYDLNNANVYCKIPTPTTLAPTTSYTTVANTSTVQEDNSSGSVNPAVWIIGASIVIAIAMLCATLVFISKKESASNRNNEIKSNSTAPDVKPIKIKKPKPKRAEKDETKTIKIPTNNKK